MDYIQSLVVHNRGAYNCMRYDFGGTGVIQLFSLIMHSFQKLVSDFGHFQTLL